MGAKRVARAVEALPTATQAAESTALDHASVAPLPFDAVILAGGRGSRLGGVSKAELQIGGRRLVDICIEAVDDAGAASIVVVGPTHVKSPVVTVREEPPFGGPAAGLAAALPLIESPWLLLLACDLPHAAELVALLTQALPRVSETGQSDGVVVIDRDSRTQWLAGFYRVRALRASLAASASRGVDTHGLPVRRLLESLDLVRVVDEHGASEDIDTPEELAQARSRTDRTGLPEHRRPPTGKEPQP